MYWCKGSDRWRWTTVSFYWRLSCERRPDKDQRSRK